MSSPNATIPHLSLTQHLLAAIPKGAMKGTRLVACALAAHADPYGRLFPGIKRISVMTDCSRATVYRAIAELEDAGLLSVVSAPADPRMPPMRQFNIPEILERSARSPLSRTGFDDDGSAPRYPLSHGEDRGSRAEDTPGGLADETQTTSKEESERTEILDPPPPPQCGSATDPPAKRGKSPSRSPCGLAECDNFACWYSLYPRKVDRGHAESMWNWALKNGGIPRLMIGALEAQLPAMKQKSPQYLPHPGTWLRGKRWLDVPDQTYEDQLRAAAKRMSEAGPNDWMDRIMNGTAS